MNCHFCGGQLIWGSDGDAEECGYTRPGVVAFLTCDDCGAFWEGAQLEDEDEEENNEEKGDE